MIKQLTGTLKVQRWTGHGEGGTELGIDLSVDKQFWKYEHYELTDEIKAWIGQGKKVTIIVEDDTSEEITRRS